MSDSIIDVDLNSLYELSTAIKQTSEDFKAIGNSINVHLQNTLERMQRTIDYFQSRLDEAQREVDRAMEDLRRAEADYERCLASQRYETDEDGNTYSVPSCAFQKGRVMVCTRAVEKAEQIRDKWQQIYDQAESIKRECEQEIERYNDPGGVFRPRGGRTILSDLANSHTETTSSKLDETIRAVNDILYFSFQTGFSSLPPSSDSFIAEMPSPEESDAEYNAGKAGKFKEAEEKVDELIKAKIDKTTPANIYEICPYCKKFKYINCICGRAENQR